MIEIDTFRNRLIFIASILAFCLMVNAPYAIARSKNPPLMPVVDLTQHLSNAAFYGHLSQVASLLKQGPNQHAKNIALRAAVDGTDYSDIKANDIKTHVAIIRLLIDAGANVNSISNGRAPYPLALAHHAAVAAILLKEGALASVASVGMVCSPNTRNPVALLTVLMKYGFKITATGVGRERLTVLHCAVSENNEGLVNFALNHGATANARDRAGRTPIFATESERIFEALADNGASLNIVDKRGLTPVHATVLNGPRRRIAWLLAAGANPNIPDALGETPLYSAATLDRLRVMRLLLQHGARVDLANHMGETPLEVAARKGELGVAQLLLRHGAQVNKKGRRGWTPLEYAAYDNHDAMVALLLSHDADVNARDHADLTAWRRATSANVRALLIRHGAIGGGPADKPYDRQACQEIVRLANRGSLARPYGAVGVAAGPLAPSDKWDDSYYTERLRSSLQLFGRPYILGTYNPGPPKYLSRVGADGAEQIVCEFGGVPSATGATTKIRVLTPFERLKLYAKEHFIRLSQVAAKWPGLGGAKALVVALQHHKDPIAFQKDSSTMILNDAIDANRLDLLSYYFHHAIGFHAIHSRSPSPSASVLYPPPEDYSPLYTAVWKGRQTALKMLLQEGANPNGLGGFQRRTALAEAVDTGSVSATRTLLSYGADPNLSPPYTAQTDAVDRIAQEAPTSDRIARAIHLLLTHGANPDSWIYDMMISVTQGKGLTFIPEHLRGPQQGMRAMWVTLALSAPGKPYLRLGRLLHTAIAIRNFTFCPAGASEKVMDLCLPNLLKGSDHIMATLYGARLKEFPACAPRIRAQQRRWLKRRDSICHIRELPRINMSGWYAYVLSNNKRALCTVRETERISIGISRICAGPQLARHDIQSSFAPLVYPETIILQSNILLGHPAFPPAVRSPPNAGARFGAQGNPSR